MTSHTAVKNPAFAGMTSKKQQQQQKQTMKKTSYPKRDIRILLLEGISPTAVETFQAAGYTQIEQ
ncbi:hypothetical protein, partial [Luteimonas panaciterrae]|uniref:hypothetical protein n=1 Tax=Luteimonas panaciterrae TaxID=363885 RepID=UPI001CFA68ED